MVPAPSIWPVSAPIAQTAPEHLVMATSGLVNLRQEWEALSSKARDQTTESEILDLLSKARELDAKLLTWTRAVPLNWKPIPASIIPASVRRAGLYRGRGDCYTDLWVATTWNSYRDSRIVVQSIILSCLRMLSTAITTTNTDFSNTSTLQTTATSTIRSLATDICACVPFLLGSQMESVQMNPYKVKYPEAEGRRVTHAHQQTAPLLGGWFILAYLGNLCTSGLCLEEEQIWWVRGQMQRILNIYTFGCGIEHS